MEALLRGVGLGGLVPNRVNVPAAPAMNLRNNARNNNNNVRRRLNLNAQHPPGGEPEMVEENIAIAAVPNAAVPNAAVPMAMNLEAVEVMSPPGSEPTVGGRRRKANRKTNRKAASRKAASRKASRKAASRKANRKANRKTNRKANRKTNRKASRRN